MTAQSGLCQTLSETPKTGFLITRLVLIRTIPSKYTLTVHIPIDLSGFLGSSKSYLSKASDLDLCSLIKIRFSGFCKIKHHVFVDITWFLFGGVPLPLGTWERLCYFIAALPGPSI